MTDLEIKTIDIKTLKWFDRINGNTYFAQEITLNYGLPNEETIFNPFQYGYSSYDYFAFEKLQKSGYFKDINKSSGFYPLHEKIIIRSNEYWAKQRELKALK